MTRAEAMAKASDLLDQNIENEIADFFDEFEYDAAIEEALRHKLARWKLEKLAEVDAGLDKIAKHSLH